MITAPTVTELATFRNEHYDQSEFAFVNMVLDQATVAIWAFTGLDTYPTDARLSKVTKWAILELASWLITQNENRDEINSPFSSERIGSYSYTKMQQASGDDGSGLYWLDMLFSALAGTDSTLATSTTSTAVFDPLEPWWVDDLSEYLRRYNYLSGVDLASFWVG